MADGSLKSGKLSTVRTVRNQAFATAIVIAIANTPPQRLLNESSSLLIAPHRGG